MIYFLIGIWSVYAIFVAIQLIRPVPYDSFGLGVSMRAMSVVFPAFVLVMITGGCTFWWLWYTFAPDFYVYVMSFLTFTNVLLLVVITLCSALLLGRR